MHNPSNDNCPMNDEREIVLTPAFEHIFLTMLREARFRADASTMFDCYSDAREANLLRAVQNFLAPLNIAAQCMASKEAVEQFRETINQIVQDIDKTASALEAEEERQGRLWTARQDH